MPDKITITNAAITKERLEKEFKVTGSALELAKSKRVNQKDKDGKPDSRLENAADEFLDMATRYFEDAMHFAEKGDLATAFGCLNYSHGWLDAGARLGLWDVKGHSDLFVVD
jgi:hypothetical protein